MDENRFNIKNYNIIEYVLVYSHFLISFHARAIHSFYDSDELISMLFEGNY